MKKIGIDARLLMQTGVGVYLRNLLYYLSELKTPNLRFYIYLRSQDFSEIKFKSPNFLKKKADFHWHTFGEQMGFLKRINKDKLDLMHFTYFSYPILYSRPFIMTIHDLIPYKYKTGLATTKNKIIYYIKYSVYKSLISNAVNKAEIVLTPSNQVRHEIIDEFGTKFKNKVVALHEGVDYKLKITKEDNRLKKNYMNPYFLYVGNFYPHKNIENLIRAFSKVDSKIHLVLTGPDDFFSRRLAALIKKLKQNQRVIFHKNAARGEIVFLYKNALALVHPSYAEGFGLTLAEAANYKLPVIASDIPVFKEIFGNNYLKFKPQSVKDMRAKINLFLKKKPNFNYSSVLKNLSFKKMTQNTLKLYLQILNRGKNRDL